jgi:AraC family transcriptional regulator of adaptative response/methylated-DNA-[protein]-cysteine methyltransferase
MSDYTKMVRVIQYLVENSRNQPTLEETTQIACLSPHHFQRKFKTWVGVSPKAFLQYLTYKEAKKNLLNGTEVTMAALNSGLSGPGRLYDLCVKLEAATPGEIKNLGRAFEIKYGFGPTPFGKSLIGTHHGESVTWPLFIH